MLTLSIKHLHFQPNPQEISKGVASNVPSLYIRSCSNHIYDWSKRYSANGLSDQCKSGLVEAVKGIQVIQVLKHSEDNIISLFSTYRFVGFLDARSCCYWWANI